MFSRLLSLSVFLAAWGTLLAQPALVKDFFPGAEDGSPNNFFAFGDRLLLRAESPGSGVEPWIANADGSDASLLLEINPGDTVIAGNSNPGNWTLYNDLVYFKARSASFGDELWVTDGTPAGTSQVIDIQAGSGNGNPIDIIVFNGLLYFTANDGINSSELWRSDGTPEGTELVIDIRPGNAPGNPVFKTIFGDKLLFTANDGTHGTELWISDGTAAGTMLLKDIREGSASASPSRYTVVGDEVFFRANDGVNGTELWKTDGTPEGTVLVKDIQPGSNPSSPDEFFAAAGKLFFTANDGTNGTELWVSDGTEAGTQLALDINPNPTGTSNPEKFTPLFPDRTYAFVADNGVTGRELRFLRLDDDGAGNVTPVIFYNEDINPGSGESSPDDLVWTGSALYFSAETLASGRELYEIPAENVGTINRLSDLNPGPISSAIDEITLVGDRVYFEATEATFGAELYTLPVRTARIRYRLADTEVRSGDTLDFGTLLLGVDPPATTLELRAVNTGTGLTLLGPQTVTDLEAPFTGSPFNDNRIPSGDSISASLTFAPTAAGEYLDAFQLTIPSVSGPDKVTFYVRGRAEVPAAEIAAAQDAMPLASGAVLDFGDLFVSQDSVIDITISNLGVLDLVIDTISVADDTHFSVAVTGFDGPLSPGAEFTFPVRYAPVAEGNHGTTLTIVSNSATDPTFQLTLQGAATVSSVQDFGIGAVRAFPNPTRDRFYLQLDQPLDRAEYRLIDLTGRVLRSGRWPAGADRHEFDLSVLRAGRYQLEIRQDRQRLLVSLLKQ
jgi:ELWxxDGT repeat protein